MNTQITTVHEDREGMLEATVVVDGFPQSVRLPNWATKDQIKKEAERLCRLYQRREADKKRRPDLED